MNYTRFFGLFLLMCFVYQVHAWGWHHASDLDTYLRNNYSNNSNKPFTAGVNIGAIGDEKRGKICKLGKGKPTKFLKTMTEYQHVVETDFRVSVPNEKELVHLTSAFCCGLVGNTFYYIGVGPMANSVAVYSLPVGEGLASAFGIMTFAPGEL